LSLKLTNISDPGASITWAREIKNVNKKLLSPSVMDVIIQRINDKEISNSKDVRKLRQILKDPVARHDFLEKKATIDSAYQKVAPLPSAKNQGIVGDIEELADAIKKYSWTSISELKGDQDVIRKIEEAEKLLKDLKKSLTK
jgi:ParB family chromosome partitioning protein